MEQFMLQIPSIGCQGCMNKIVKKLQTLPGLEIVGTSIPTKTLSLHYNPQEVTPEQIEQAISEIGHRLASVSPISSDN